MSISMRIILGFAVGILLMVGVGGYALNEVGEVRSVNEKVVDRDIAAYRQLEAAHNAQAAMALARARVLGAVLARQQGTAAGGSANATVPLDSGIADWERSAASASASVARVQAAISDFAGNAVDVDRRAAWNGIAALAQQANTALARLQQDARAQFALLRNGDLAGALAADTALRQEENGFDTMMGEADRVLNEGVQAGVRRVDHVYEQSRYSIGLALLLAVLVAVVAVVLIRRSIDKPIYVLIETMERVGRGDLTIRASADGPYEMARLGGSLNTMVDGLRAIAAQSRDATTALNASVAEIRASAQEQAASVEEQLAAVQQTAATVDQITHSGTQITRRAQEVIAAAQATAASGAAGLRAVEDTAQAMELIHGQGEAVAGNIVALSEKTQAISEIITSVNDISERTHLLALNAAIEAAAAGENGRSFAVVAAEMKSLADQAKEATVQVRSILGDIQRGINTSVMLTEESVKRVSAGRERSTVTQRTIEEMAGGMEESVQTFQQIVASTNQQQLGIEQVMVALQNIRQASQQTAAGTRQLDSAASALGDLSRRLLATAEGFRI